MTQNKFCQPRQHPCSIRGCAPAGLWSRLGRSESPPSLLYPSSLPHPAVSVPLSSVCLTGTSWRSSEPPSVQQESHPTTDTAMSRWSLKHADKMRNGELRQTSSPFYIICERHVSIVIPSNSSNPIVASFNATNTLLCIDWHHVHHVTFLRKTRADSRNMSR